MTTYTASVPSTSPEALAVAPEGQEIVVSTKIDTSGGPVTEKDFDDQYGDALAPGSVYRNGSNVHVYSMADLRDTDRVMISDGGSNIEVQVKTLKDMGLGHMLEDFIYGDEANTARETPREQQLREANSRYATPEQIVRNNLDSSLEHGDISSRVHNAATLLFDTGELMGVDAQNTLDLAMDAFETGDYSQFEQMGGDVKAARATIEGAYGALESEALAEIGQMAMIELERAGALYPEVRRAILQVGAGVLSGQMGRGAWASLHRQVTKAYGQRLNSLNRR